MIAYIRTCQFGTPRSYPHSCRVAHIARSTPRIRTPRAGSDTPSPTHDRRRCRTRTKGPQPPPACTPAHDRRAPAPSCHAADTHPLATPHTYIRSRSSQHPPGRTPSPSTTDMLAHRPLISRVEIEILAEFFTPPDQGAHRASDRTPPPTARRPTASHHLDQPTSTAIDRPIPASSQERENRPRRRERPPGDTEGPHALDSPQNRRSALTAHAPIVPIRRPPAPNSRSYAHMPALSLSSS